MSEQPIIDEITLAFISRTINSVKAVKSGEMTEALCLARVDEIRVRREEHLDKLILALSELEEVSLVSLTARGLDAEAAQEVLDFITSRGILD